MIVALCNPRQISGGRAGYDGAKRRKGSKVHAAVDTLGNLLARLFTPANEQDRAQVGELAQAVQQVTGQSVELAFVDQGYTGDVPAQEAKEHGIQLEVVKLPQAKRGFVLLPRRWVVERSFAWTTRILRLVRDYERLPATLAGLNLVVFACLMLYHWKPRHNPGHNYVQYCLQTKRLYRSINEQYPLSQSDNTHKEASSRQATKE